MIRKFLPLLGIFILALVLRLVLLGQNPPSLNWDEVSHGYNAYSILKTGSDEWGQVLPWANFRAYGDYPLPLYMYFSMPGILLLGLTNFSIRLPSALLGSLLVIVTYFLAFEVFQNRKLSLVSAFLAAISPWSFFTSRQVLQSTPAVFFLALGVWLFFKGIKDKRYFIVLGTLSLGLSAYAYHNTRILAPVFFIILIYLFRNELIKKWRNFAVSVIVATIFFVPLAFVLTSTSGTARSLWVGILDQGAINRIDEARGASTLPPPLPKIIYNKVSYSAEMFAQNYIGYFSPIFLGFEGGTQYQFSIPGFGIIYPVSLIFFYIGLINFIFCFRRAEPRKKFILIWFLLAPIPAAITKDPFQVVRASAEIPVVYLVIVNGVRIANNFLKRYGELVRYLFFSAILGVLLVLSIRYMYNFWFIYPKNYSFAWQYGYEQVVDYIKQNYNQYPKIFVTKAYGEPHEFLLFYLQYDPNTYKQDPNLVRYFRSNWFWVDSFDKFVFLNDWEVKSKTFGKSGDLLITSPGNYPPGSRKLKTIYFLNGQPDFDIVSL